MPKRITPFFATHADLSQLLADVNHSRPIKIVAAGLFDSPAVHELPLPSSLDPATYYLVTDRDAPIAMREVEQRGGGRKFALDQLINPRSVGLHAGGLLTQQCLIAGQLGTTADDPVSLELYGVIGARIRTTFEKVKSYYVGREASQLLDTGVRLTTSPRSPAIYDLVRG